MYCFLSGNGAGGQGRAPLLLQVWEPRCPWLCRVEIRLGIGKDTDSDCVSRGAACACAHMGVPVGKLLREHPRSPFPNWKPPGQPGFGVHDVGNVGCVLCGNHKALVIHTLSSVLNLDFGNQSLFHEAHLFSAAPHVVPF